jgi:hypothetical protein
MRTNSLSRSVLMAVSTLAACSDAALAPDRAISPSVEPAHVGGSVLASAPYSAWSEPANLDPIAAEIPVNMTGSNDQQPTLSRNGLSLYFASNRPTTDLPDEILDQNIWVSQRACTDQCPWSKPQLVAAVNIEDVLDVSPSLSRDQHQLFFASQRPHDCYPPASSQCTDRDLWVSYREDVHDDFGWQAPVNLGPGINSSAEEVAPSYFANEDAGVPEIFFNRGELVGDIYVSRMVNGVWGDVNLAQGINSDAADQRPSISHDGLELYFWSNRAKVAGELTKARIWVATRDDVNDLWSVPVTVDFSGGDLDGIMPFIHSHGTTETLLLVRPFSPVLARDLWISQRTRLSGPE